MLLATPEVVHALKLPDSKPPLVMPLPPTAVTDVGLREAVGPEGETLALRPTVPAEPVVSAVLMVEVELLPWPMLRLVGLAPIEKSSVGRELIVRPTVVVWLPLVAVPVMVI